MSEDITTTQPTPVVEEPKRDLSKERLDACLPLASAFISRITKEGFLPDSYASRDEAIAAATPIVKDMLQLYLDQKSPLAHVGFTFQLALGSLQYIQDMLVASLNQSLETANEKFWGKPYSEVTAEDLDIVLKK